MSKPNTQTFSFETVRQMAEMLADIATKRNHQDAYDTALEMICGANMYIIAFMSADEYRIFLDKLYETMQHDANRAYDFMDRFNAALKGV